MGNDFFGEKSDLLKRGVIDNNNKIIRWSKKQKDQHIILQYIAKFFDVGIYYSEIEVNQIIRNSIIFDDYVLIRRELIEKKYLRRTEDCKKYWREPTEYTLFDV